MSHMRLSRLCLLICLLLTFSISMVYAEHDPCTVNMCGTYFDLSQLTSSTDYKFNSSDGREYSINVCRSVATETWAAKVDKPEDIGGFTRLDHGDFSIGSYNTTLMVHDGSPVMYMTNGSPCPGTSDMRASTAIRFICDTSVFGAGEPRMIAELPPPAESACSFYIEWRTHIACPTSQKHGLGLVGVLGIILGILLVLYIVLGTLYNRFVLGLRGFDQIPRYSLFSFSDTVQFFRSCIESVRYRSSGSFGGSRWSNANSGGYSGIASSHEEGVHILSGPPGYLDEGDEDDEEPSRSDDPERGGQPNGMDSNGVIRL